MSITPYRKEPVSEMEQNGSDWSFYMTVKNCYDKKESKGLQ